MIKNNTKIREGLEKREILIGHPAFTHYSSKKTINSLIEKKILEKLAKSHILVL